MPLRRAVRLRRRPHPAETPRIEGLDAAFRFRSEIGGAVADCRVVDRGSPWAS